MRYEETLQDIGERENTLEKSIRLEPRFLMLVANMKQLACIHISN